MGMARRHQLHVLRVTAIRAGFNERDRPRKGDVILRPLGIIGKQKEGRVRQAFDHLRNGHIVPRRLAGTVNGIGMRVRHIVAAADMHRHRLGRRTDGVEYLLALGGERLGESEITADLRGKVVEVSLALEVAGQMDGFGKLPHLGIETERWLDISHGLAFVTPSQLPQFCFQAFWLPGRNLSRIRNLGANCELVEGIAPKLVARHVTQIELQLRISRIGEGPAGSVLEHLVPQTSNDMGNDQRPALSWSLISRATPSRLAAMKNGLAKSTSSGCSRLP